MLNTKYGLVPVMTTSAGSCLTESNWKEVNVNNASFYLDFLLLKPGYNTLKKIGNLKKYLGWSGTLILNGMHLHANRLGVFHFVSPYDGSKVSISVKELIELIIHLQPDAVVLPQHLTKHYPELGDHWNEVIYPFIAEEEVKAVQIPYPHGVYIKVTKGQTKEEIINKMNEWSDWTLYTTGEFTPELLMDLSHEQLGFIESDEPAKSAISGQVYCQNGQMDLTHSMNELNFEPIDRACHCPTCSQGWTRAYLHHLLQHTPLLCQRLLIQHNASYFS